MTDLGGGIHYRHLGRFLGMRKPAGVYGHELANFGAQRPHSGRLMIMNVL
jgi:hypothetical protein